MQDGVEIVRRPERIVGLDELKTGKGGHPLYLNVGQPGDNGGFFKQVVQVDPANLTRIEKVPLRNHTKQQLDMPAIAHRDFRDLSRLGGAKHRDDLWLETQNGADHVGWKLHQVANVADGNIGLR